MDVWPYCGSPTTVQHLQSCSDIITHIVIIFMKEKSKIKFSNLFIDRLITIENEGRAWENRSIKNNGIMGAKHLKNILSYMIHRNQNYLVSIFIFLFFYRFLKIIFSIHFYKQIIIVWFTSSFLTKSQKYKIDTCFSHNRKAGEKWFLWFLILSAGKVYPTCPSMGTSYSSQ